MILKLKKQWVIDSESFEDIADVFKDWFTFEELKNIFKIDLNNKDYEKWNDITYLADNKELYSDSWFFLKYLYDNDGLELERDEVITKLLENKKGFFDFSSDEGWEYYAVIKEFDLEGVKNEN